MNIHIQNIIAVQDASSNSLRMPSSINQPYHQEETPKLIEGEVLAYKHSSKSPNETFRIFSQSDHEDDEVQQPPMKKLNANNSGFQQVKSKIHPTSANKFKETIQTKQSSASAVVTITPPPSSIVDTDLASEGRFLSREHEEMNRWVVFE